MKKWMILFLCFALVISLCACNQIPEQVRTVNNMIAALGTVSLDSGEGIAAAERAYAALSEEDKAQVQGADALVQARKTYNELRAKEASDAISAIGEVDLQSADAINAAQVALDRLTEEQKALVKNAADLEQAKEDYFYAQVADIEAAIDAIGKVTVDSRGAINEAWAVYNRYDSDIQAAVSNFKTLEQAEEALFMAQVQTVEAAISAIGEVDLNSGETITAARKLFDSCDAAVQAAVSNRSDLTDAEADFEALRIAVAYDAIAAIGEVTLDKAQAVAKAREEYDKLPAELQRKVQNAAVLEGAERVLANLKTEAHQKAVDEALSKLEVQVDYERAIRWYYAPSEPYYADERSFVLPYIGADGAGQWLRIKYHYTGMEWVFFENVTVTVDGTAYELAFEYFDVTRDNDAEVWEWADVQTTEEDVAMLRAIAESEETVVRFEGTSHFFEFTMSEADKDGIALVLDAFAVLNAEE